MLDFSKILHVNRAFGKVIIIEYTKMPFYYLSKSTGGISHHSMLIDVCSTREQTE